MVAALFCSTHCLNAISQTPSEWPAAIRQLVSQREADAAEAATAEVRSAATGVRWYDLRPKHGLFCRPC